jgi:hypothetical protein
MPKHLGTIAPLDENVSSDLEYCLDSSSLFFPFGFGWSVLRVRCLSSRWTRSVQSLRDVGVACTLSPGFARPTTLRQQQSISQVRGTCLLLFLPVLPDRLSSASASSCARFQLRHLRILFPRISACFDGITYLIINFFIVNIASVAAFCSANGTSEDKLGVIWDVEEGRFKGNKSL